MKYVLCTGDKRMEFSEDPSKPHGDCPWCKLGFPKVSVEHIPIRDPDGVVRRFVVRKGKQDAVE